MNTVHNIVLCALYITSYCVHWT